MGVPGVTLPDDPIQAQPTYAAALAAFEALPPVRILFDNGAGGAPPGAPVPGFEQSFARFPLPGHAARARGTSAPDGTLTDAPPAAAGADAFTWDKAARPPTDFTGNTGRPGGLWTATPPYHWTQNPPGTALSYLTAPLAADTAVVGAGALQAWIRSSAPDVDLQVTVSEVRPGRQGDVRAERLAAQRAAASSTARKSTLLEPVPSLAQADAAPLPAGRFAQGHRPALLRGPRVPGRLADPRDDRGARRRPAGLGVRRDLAARRPRRRVASPTRARCRRAWSCPVVPGVGVPTGAAALPGPARRALPALPAAGLARPPDPLGF